MSQSTPILDQRGRVIGYTVSNAGKPTDYLSPSGKIVARIRDGKTLDKTGAIKGKGDQGLRLF